MAGAGNELDGHNAVAAPPPPGLQPLDVREGQGRGAAVGYNFQMANRDFFETEILVAFDQRMVDVDGLVDVEEREGSEAWIEVRRVLR
eukprot:1297111-Heterocapsa_arctica.AAC.1